MLSLLSLDDLTDLIFVAFFLLLLLTFSLFLLTLLLEQSLLLGKRSCRLGIFTLFRFRILSCRSLCCKCRFPCLFCGQRLFFEPLFLGQLGHELGIRLGDQVQAAWLAILLANRLHLRQCLLGLVTFRSSDDEAVALADVVMEELQDVLLRGGCGVGLTVELQAAVHLGISEVGAFDFFFWELLDSLFQEVIFGIEDDAELRNDLLVHFGVLISWHLSGLRLIVAFLHEDSLSIFDVARIAIDDETLVHASG